MTDHARSPRVASGSPAGISFRGIALGDGHGEAPAGSALGDDASQQLTIQVRHAWPLDQAVLGMPKRSRAPG